MYTLLIQVHKKFPYIVKVMLTGHANEAAIERSRREANLHRCLSKPWSAAELIEVVTSAME
jgi:response regulator RpfG family c-di-GMP phosphodiesterase